MVTSVIALWERAKRRPGGQPDAQQHEREEDARGRAG
jgi:hypothetical protein